MELGVDYTIKWNYHSITLYPNTAIVKLQSDNLKVGVVGYSISGGRIQIVKSVREKVVCKKVIRKN
jgi:L-serine deaminase